MVLKELEKKYPKRKINYKEVDDDLYGQYGFNSKGLNKDSYNIYGFIEINLIKMVITYMDLT